MIQQLTLPLTRDMARALESGQRCLLSGEIYTARDAAHQRLCQCLARGEPLPLPLENAVIYYVGPTPARDGQVIGSAGPTTAYRMDAYAPQLIELGQTGMIGKGKRSAAVVQAMIRCGAVYFGATGGAGALLAQCIVESELVAYEDLGAEAIRKLTVRDFPVTVIIDSRGNNLYEMGPAAYLQHKS